MLTPRRGLAALAATGSLLAALPLGAGAGTSATAVPSTAAPAGASSAAADAQPPAGKAWLEGWVLDRAGDPQLDVVVAAYRPSDLGKPVATALTYAGPNVHGDEVDGYFRLQVPKGRYVIRFGSLPDADDPFRSTWADGKAPVRVSGGTVEVVGDVALTRVRKVAPRTGIELDRTRVKPRQRGEVTVTVSNPEVRPVTGAVRVTVDGRRVGDVALRRGAATADLPRLGLGTHRVSAQFLGNDAVRAGKVVTTTLKVVRR
ncbi:Ig-like domain-containing protein [Nocardioides sp. SYSU DS0663]|uniref:Ig-like domain-containing protein n=1 Tax=Nocardioides sp. SYSU DS0663 TaxID=3416445 RepID=UPI003F4B8455